MKQRVFVLFKIDDVKFSGIFYEYRELGVFLY